MASTWQVKFSEDVVHLDEAKLLTDFTIIASDGIELPAHRQILAARSEVFLRMLSTENSREVLTGRCEITDVDGRTMDLLLRHLYGSFVTDADWTVETLEKVFVAANKYQILSVASAYAALLQNKLTEDNAAHMLVLAERYKATDLKTAALDYIAKCRRKFLAAGHLETVRGYSSVLVQEILREIPNGDQYIRLRCCCGCKFSAGCAHRLGVQAD